ncbi:MAG: LysR family transcriptional regulator [Coriobacteriaceae bacterium]|nr:LysR family transcriptional regulator [Coriobacteriaceae bacterium]
MNLSQLYYFQKLAELQHYTHAAEELFISQPTLSHAISSLEDELGCKLFRKQGRNVRLTDDGVLFQKYVAEALGVLDDGVAALKIRQGKLSGTVQVGAIATVRADYLPALVLEYRRKRGNLIELRIEQGSTQELVDDLIAGKLDLAIASKVNDPRISFTHLFDQSMGVIVRNDHPLAARDAISLAELAKFEVYTYRADLPVGKRLDAFLRANGFEPATMMLNRDSDDEVMLGGIVSREPVVGLCLLTSSLLPYRNLKVLPLIEPAARDIYSVGVLRLADARLSPVAKDFLDHVESFPVTNQLLPQ